MRAEAIRRPDTVVTDLQFASGGDLRVADAVRLQDARVLVVRGLQLIRPSNARAYFRSPPDSSLDNNVENLPVF